jgi:uncharacterized integral membrane protein
MRQLNFLLIFSFGLATVMFTLENTAATTVKFLPGVSTTLPLAALLLVVGGIGATAAWVFAVWTGVVKKVENLSTPDEVTAQQVRIRELEDDVQALSGRRGCPVGPAARRRRNLGPNQRRLSRWPQVGFGQRSLVELA